MEEKRNSGQLQLRLAHYQTIVAQVSGDGALIWLRYNAMLTANSILAAVIGVVSTQITLATATVLLPASVFGLALCWNWWLLTRSGWELQHYWVEEAEKFDWEGQRSPFAPYQDWCKDKKYGTGTGDLIYRCAQRVIFLFIGAYGCLFLYGLVSLVCVIV